MWIVFGIAAILTALINVLMTFNNKDAKWFRFASISLTALTLCAEYSMIARWVERSDWSALMDVVPAMTKALWFLTLASIIINSISLFKQNTK